MSLFEQWKEIVDKERSQGEHDEFWKAYFNKEKTNYEHILENHTAVFSGPLCELSEKFSMTQAEFVGFLDGINTSLKKELELETLTETSDINLDIDYERLYFNMLDAKADWLYNLPEWDGVLSLERRKEITKEFRVSKIAVSNKIGRNDSCTCGSGKKYKKCCGK